MRKPTQQQSFEAVNHEFTKLATAIRAFNWKYCDLNDASVPFTEADEDAANTLRFARESSFALVVSLYQRNIISERTAERLHTQWELIPPVLVDAPDVSNEWTKDELSQFGTTGQ
jgi:hypothetical protein